MKSIYSLIALLLIASQVQADPFEPAKAPVVVQQSVSVQEIVSKTQPKSAEAPKPIKEILPRLSGIICDTAKPMAILNNQLIVKGRMFQQFQIKDITPDFVILHSSKTQKEYSLSVDTFSNNGSIKVQTQ